MNDFMTSWKRKKEPEIEFQIKERREQNNIAHSVAFGKNSGEKNNLDEKKKKTNYVIYIWKNKLKTKRNIRRRKKRQQQQ